VVQKDIYINGLGCISPQPTLNNTSFLEEPVSAESNRLKAIDPNYKEFVPPEMVRRMGRIIKMGVAAAKTCMADAGDPTPEMIITGTGLGCIQDTEKFLGNMISNNEEFLTPTSFIQSTHNTIGAQIALLLKCHGYNFTYVHRGFSFETAIIDSLMKLISGSAANVLLGCADELTDNSFTIQNRMGFWRSHPVDNLHIYTYPGKGAIAGEGAAFFLLETEKRPNSYAVLKDAGTLFNPRFAEAVKSWINEFLVKQNLSIRDIDLLMTGKNGDAGFDPKYDEVTDNLLNDIPMCNYKHLCGDYMTATGFATWLAARILHRQAVPRVVQVTMPPASLKNILIYNQYRGINHSLILLSQA